MVKKETVIYAIIIGFILGFISGTVFAVYKLGANNTSQQHEAAEAGPQTSNVSSQQQEAINNLEREVTADESNVEAWTRLGHLYYDTDKAAKAIKAYNKSLELQPDNADVWTDLGVMYRRNNQPEKAIEAFEHAFSINPNHAPSRLNKGIVLLYDFDQPVAAIETWKELLAIDPEAKLNNGMPLKQAVEEIQNDIDSHEHKE